jgi:hypothetical protein
MPEATFFPMIYDLAVAFQTVITMTKSWKLEARGWFVTVHVVQNVLVGVIKSLRVLPKVNVFVLVNRYRFLENVALSVVSYYCYGRIFSCSV